MKMLFQISVAFWSLPTPYRSQTQKLSRRFHWWWMKWIKNCSRSTTPEERFSDLEVDRHIYASKPLQRLIQEDSFKLVCLTNNYRCCTVLLVLSNSVSNLTNLYLWNQNRGRKSTYSNITLQLPLPYSLVPGRLPWTLILTTPSLKKSWIRPCKGYHRCQ